MLRCRCKHKHTEHDPNTRRCKKRGCQCSCFDSPWVCNCNHAWADHEHKLIRKEVSTFGGLHEEATANFQAAVHDINNYSDLKRGGEHNAAPM